MEATHTSGLGRCPRIFYLRNYIEILIFEFIQMGKIVREIVLWDEITCFSSQIAVH